MKFKFINTKEQFEKLQNDDLILVKWSDFFVKHTPGSKKIMLYNIYKNKYSQHEIICKRKNNHYFNYDKYLQGLSAALEVYKITDIKS